MKDELSAALINLLIDGPSSFAALHRSVIRNCAAFSAVSVPATFSRLQSLEDAGLVRVTQMESDGKSWRTPTATDRERALRAYENWLPTASDEAVSLDEVGLWYEITESGRESWIDHQSAADRAAAWSLDEVGNSTVSIRAESEEVAENTLRWWLSERAPKNVSQADKRIRPIAGFALKDGSWIKGGVELTYTYRSAR